MTAQKIHAAIAKVKAEVGPVAKGRKAGDGSFAYQYRGIEDVYDAAQRAFASHGVYSVPWVEYCESESREQTRRGQGGKTYTVVVNYCRLHVIHTFYAEDGSYIQTRTIGEGLDSGDKASGKSMTVSHRHAICQLLMLPFNNVEPEQDDHTQEVFVTLEQIKQLKHKWWAPRKDSLSGLDKGHITAKFNNWVQDTVGDIFDVTRISEWEEGWFEKCQHQIEKDRRKSQSTGRSASPGEQHSEPSGTESKTTSTSSESKKKS